MAMRKPLSQTSALEWLAAAIGLALLLLVFAIIGRDAFSNEGARPPELLVEVRRITPSGHGFLVEFEAANSGGSTAAAVEIEGTMSMPGQRPETASTTIDYVAANANAAGGLFFTQDPRQGRLSLRALGYQEP